ncbi:MAG TPA: Uma2 family endonuclease [Pyrinomonadaceae bacterium]|nr:Uma2 family endonuclease [Pyrinomonadaceae bacterium]
MSRRKAKAYISVEEYLAGERESPVRHEYVAGEVYALAGASDRHNRIALNVASRLNEFVSEPCETFMSDMKIRVSPEVFYYPDVVVACDGAGADAYFRAEPRLIIEVISPSTERIDRHEKMAAYKSVASLEEYVLASQDEMRVEVYRRTGGEWEVSVFTGAEDELEFSSVALSLSVAEIYRNVRLPEDVEDA